MRKTVIPAVAALLLSATAVANGADGPDRLYPVARDGKGVYVDRKGKYVWTAGD